LPTATTPPLRKGGRSDRNTKAEPGFIKRRNRINGQFRAHLIEMLESPAWKALSLGARRVIDRIEIELARHGGNDNGRLPVTKLDFVEYGVHHNGVAPAIREAEALGFIRVTEHGRGGNAEHRQPNKSFLTFARGRDSRAQPPTDDWRKIKTTEEAEMIASRARNAKSVRAVQFAERRALKTKNRYLKPVPKPVPKTGTEMLKSPVPKTGTTGSVRKPVPLSISRVGSEPATLASLSASSAPVLSLPESSARKFRLSDDPQSRQAYVGTHARLPLELRMLALGLPESRSNRRPLARPRAFG